MWLFENNLLLSPQTNSSLGTLTTQKDGYKEVTVTNTQLLLEIKANWNNYSNQQQEI